MRHGMTGRLVLLAAGIGVTGAVPGRNGPARAAAAPVPAVPQAVLVRFQPRVRVDAYTDQDRVTLDRVGVVEPGGGALAGGVLLLLRVDGERGMCKGPGCSGPYYARLIGARGRLIHLPALTPERSWLTELLAGNLAYEELAEDTAADRTLLAFLARRGTLEVDPDAGVPGLAVHRRFTFRELEFRLTSGDADGVPDTSLLVPVFDQPELGTVLTTRPEASPQDYFYYPEDALHPGDPAVDIGDCRNARCYRTNAFYLFRPDGTYLRYTYDPPFGVGEIRLTGPGRLAAEYLHWTRWGCSDGQADYHSVVSPAVLDPDRLRPIGLAGDQRILGLADPEDPYVRAFYERYRAARSAWSYGDEPPPLTFAEFARELPMFFWRDPFGRLIRFSNAAYLPPLTCEPVIYLYPEREGTLEIRLGRRVRLLDADPAYPGGWTVHATPDGRIGERHRYLFWEGAAGLLPRPTEGFVVPRGEVAAFFQRTLTRLGLVDSEIRDFLTAWLPAFADAPYYRVGFYERAIIDRYVPLEVTPAAVTVIRILFDYQPLAAPLSMREPVLPPPPTRRGSTVVEWGGLKR